MPSLPLGSHSIANRRSGGCPIQRVYPWLLFASTTIAATFCLAYITKPVIVASPSLDIIAPPVALEVAANSTPPPAPAAEKLLPDHGTLPGEVRQAPQDTPPSASASSDFEETNIRIQHVLDAESPSGDISRIVIDVPVLYQSRNLHWTQQEAANARQLLARLSDYQEKSRSLRDEGAALQEAWDKLMASSIPAQALRADSPSLPGNQYNPLSPGAPVSSDTIETIKLRRAQE